MKRKNDYMKILRLKKILQNTKLTNILFFRYNIRYFSKFGRAESTLGVVFYINFIRRHMCVVLKVTTLVIWTCWYIFPKNQSRAKVNRSTNTYSTVTSSWIYQTSFAIYYKRQQHLNNTTLLTCKSWLGPARCIQATLLNSKSVVCGRYQGVSRRPYSPAKDFPVGASRIYPDDPTTPEKLCLWESAYIYGRPYSPSKALSVKASRVYSNELTHLQQLCLLESAGYIQTTVLILKSFVCWGQQVEQ